ncbi:MAG TPA: tyrosine--tRNA ligase [Candidatus Omnitrophota bacterium]|nr:tyrosine--tRNA ligase [Candidatus Omnitrophota bacterium]HPS37569.1 tyrosine--tRNA ligase [Candidatus Omnitrophota bacterium]
MFPSVQDQLEVFRENLVDLISEKELAQKLEVSIKKNRPLRIKYGADPSAPDLHLGHTVPLRKLRQLQDLGHDVVFIIGDFTARIGDPSGKSETRPMLTEEQVLENAKTYQDQVFRILDKKKTEVYFNSKWLGKMTPEDFLRLTAQYTVARILERDDFSKRYKSGEPIALVEFLYPLLQGHDSVVLRSDIELGGTDQMFNLLVGRELQKADGQEPQVVMTMPLIEGLDGVQKMSKSLGNHIAVKDTPKEMFGKVMSVSDAMMERYYRYLAAMPKNEVDGILAGLKSGEMHPREMKARLAERIVTLFHSEKEGKRAREEFDEIFKNKGLPDEVPVVKIAHPTIDIVSLLAEAQLVASKSEGRRMVEQGGVKIGGEKVTDPKAVITVGEAIILQCGKRKFAKIVPS